jgi:hypothetical protein
LTYTLFEGTGLFGAVEPGMRAGEGPAAERQRGQRPRGEWPGGRQSGEHDEVDDKKIKVFSIQSLHERTENQR